ncbi:MAG: DUF4338 domain-containing protein [Ruminococcaceae bacterium]|nr:DUF4338 domain-containing protein [Oscillospiraceae bacterium]
MGSSSETKEQTVASEKYQPTLNDYYNECFKRLVERMSHNLPINRSAIIKRELDQIDVENADDQLETLKYASSLSVLIDLSLQGWIFDIDEGALTLKMENDNLDDKQKLRYRLSAEKNAQFKTPSVAAFIRQMESNKKYQGNNISVRDLIGDKHFLIQQIQNGQRVCDPYIQLVTSERDTLTGYKLSDIWRYFRYTWSIPYKTMPGRNLFYLVRDRLQPYHPIIGIFALGNSVLNLTVRDDDIGWTVEAIKKNMALKTEDTYCEQIISETDGKRVKTKICRAIETEAEHFARVTEYANKMYPLLLQSIEDAISEIYLKDLGYHRNTKYPKQEKIEQLIAMAEEYAEKSINNKNNEKSPNWEEEAQSNLFKRKRAAELAKLLETKCIFNGVTGSTSREKLNQLLSSEAGRKAIHTALIANRKRKIGSNMMDIIVCGSIPPYNELLGGKLISILSCSPSVISDYTHRYENQISEIASRMKGQRVVRDSRLVYLGTTSLYAVGSSQYNRIKVPLSENSNLEFRKMGITEGFGTVFFSKETTSLFSKLLELQDGGKKINHVFGEGTSPRFRMISRGLSSIGIKAEAFLKHYSPRIVYSINLANNTNEYLLGFDKDVNYGYDLNNSAIVEQKTQELIDYWYNRWLTKRLTTVDIEQRLNDFDIETILLGNI